MLDVLPMPDVEADAPPRPPGPPPARPAVISRRWRRFAGGVLLVASVSTLLWWQRAVATDPRLAFHGGGNAFRSAPGDLAGITQLGNTLGTEVRVEFEPGGRFMAYFDLFNGGPRSVRIEDVRPQSFHYWGFDGLALSGDERDVFPATESGAFRPFTLAAGETRSVRLDFRLADCDPARLQDGGYSVVDSLPVTYKVLGFRRTIDVPFDRTALSVHASGDCNLPLLPQP